MLLFSGHDEFETGLFTVQQNPEARIGVQKLVLKPSNLTGTVLLVQGQVLKKGCPCVQHLCLVNVRYNLCYNVQPLFLLGEVGGHCWDNEAHEV